MTHFILQGQTYPDSKLKPSKERKLFSSLSCYLRCKIFSVNIIANQIQECSSGIHPGDEDMVNISK